MNTQEPAPGEQPGHTEPSAQTPHATTQPSEQPPASANVDDYSVDQLMAALDGNPEDFTPPANEPPPASEPASEQPQTPEPGEPTHPTEKTPAKKQEAIRLRFSALPKDQQEETAEAYRMVRDGEAADMLEAYHKLRGQSGSPQAPAAQAPTPETPTEPEPPALTEIEQLKAKREELREQRRQAKAEFDTDTEDRLNAEIEDTTLELAKLQAKAEAAAELQQRSQKDSAQKWQSDYDAAVDELEASFPDVLDDNSEFTKRLTEKQDAALYRKDPITSDPRYLLTLAQQVATELGRKPSGTPPTPPPSAPRPTGSRLAPNSPAPVRMSDDQARAAFFDQSVSADDILDALELASRK